MIKERRRHARLRIPLEAYYRVTSDDEWREGTIETVGAGGAALICDAELETGDRLAGLRFTVPAAGQFAEARLELASRVVQAKSQKHHDRPPSYILGLRFSNIAKEESEHLRQFVFQRLTGTEPPPAPTERSGLEVEPDSARAALGRMLGRAAAREVKLRRRVEGLQERLSYSESARKELQASHEKLRGETESLRRELAQLDSSDGEAGSLRREIGRLESSRDEAEAARARFESRVVEAKQAQAGLEEELERSREEAQRLRQEVESETVELRAELERQRAAQAELSGKLEEAASTEAELRERLETHLAEAREAQAGLENELRDARQEADRLRQEAESAAEELGQELEHQRAGEAELSKQLEEVAATEAELSTKLEEAASTEAELRERLETHLAEARETQAGLEDELRDTKAEADHQRREAESEAEKLREEVERQRAAEQQLREQLEQAVEAENDFREQVEKLEAERDDLEERLVLSAAGKIELEGELRRMREESDGLRRVWADREFQLRSELETAGVDMSALPEMPEPEGFEALRPLADIEAEISQEAARVDRAAGDDIPTEAASREAPPVVEEAEELDATPAPAAGGLARRMLARLGIGGRSRAAEEAEEPAAPETAGDERTAKLDPAEVEETVRAWASAWSDQRVEDYLAFYSRDFKPATADGEGESDAARPAWLPPLDGMELVLGPISQSAVEPGRVSVEFEQTAETDSYSRRVNRTLELVWEDGAWKIASEAFDELGSETAQAEPGS